MKFNFKENKEKGITLLALVITIIILLILASIAIGMLGSENGLFTKIIKAKEVHIKAEMKEQLILLVQDLQVEKLGRATLDDITQEWLNSKIGTYSPNLIEDASVNGKIVVMTKDGVTGKFLIDQDLSITEIEYNKTNIEFSYDTIKIVDTNKVQLLIHVRERINGLTKVEFPDQEPFIANGTKDEKQINYEVELGKEYKITITSEDGNKEEKIIKIDNYYYKITKTLGDKVIIDNNAIKVVYNKEYQANITAEENYVITGLIVTMGGQTVTTDENNIVDIATGKIYIKEVIGDIEIIVTSKKNEIEITEEIINESTAFGGTNTEKASILLGTKLYIKLKANVEMGKITEINPPVPYQVNQNGIYKFTIKAEYNGKNIEIEKNIIVNQYISEEVTGYVKYDAGEWTQKQIEELGNLYNINKEHTVSNDKVFTFGGFTYKMDKNENINPESNTSGVITNRNDSINPEEGHGIPSESGWKVFSSCRVGDKIYVSKLIHAGSPENFVCVYGSANATIAEYILSSGDRNLSNSIYQARSWDMYKDQKQLDLIEKVGITKYEIAHRISQAEKRKTGSTYWLLTNGETSTYQTILSDGSFDYFRSGHCFGIRPVITLKDKVYITKGDGTKEDPYVLALEQ